MLVQSPVVGLRLCLCPDISNLTPKFLITWLLFPRPEWIPCALSGKHPVSVLIRQQTWCNREPTQLGRPCQHGLGSHSSQESTLMNCLCPFMLRIQEWTHVVMKASMALLQNYDAVYKLSYRNKILYNSKKDLFYQEIPLLLLSFAWPVYRVPGDTRSRTQGQGTQQEEARMNWNALAHRVDRINKTRPSGDLYLWLCLDQWPFQFFWVLNLACAIHSPQPPLVVTGRNMTDLDFSFSQPAFTTTQALALIYVNRFQMCSPQQGHGFHTKAFTLKQTCGPAKPPEPV